MIEPGIHALPAEQYHADEVCEQPALSAGIARLLANSTPLHAWTAHPKLNPNFEREDKAVFDLGTVAHELILEKSYARVVVIEADSWRTKDAQEQRDEARADRKIPLLTKDWVRVQAMVEAVRLQLDGRSDDPPLFSEGEAEPTIVWHERDVVCKARLDWLRTDLRAIDDLKTTGRSANPVLWAKRTLWSIGADVQAAFYLRGVKAVTGATPEFRYVLAESTPPFAVSVVGFESSVLELGAAKVDRAIDRWRECLASGAWPAYPEHTYYAEMPAWAELEFLENDAEAMTA